MRDKKKWGDKTRDKKKWVDNRGSTGARNFFLAMNY